MARSVLIGILTGAAAITAAQQLTLDQVVTRLDGYVEEYPRRLSVVVAEELYRQSQDERLTDPVADSAESASPISHEDRVLRSDYALTRAADKDVWVGYRDTFEVNGQPIRDREDRLQQLLTSGTPAGAARIAEESSRFNLGNSIVKRNINVPTLVLEMLHPRNRWRFSLTKSGEETIGGTATWRLEYKEREHPTFIRNPNGRDRLSHGLVWVDPRTGEVWQTRLTWDGAPAGAITVTYGRVTGIDVLVPLTMSERYEQGPTTTLTGDASYSNYRRFQTSGRLIN